MAWALDDGGRLVVGRCTTSSTFGQHCSPISSPFGPKDAYYGTIVGLARPLLGEYHNVLRNCAMHEDCRDRYDEFFRNITSLNESNFDYNLVEGLRNSPYPQLAGIYSILKTLGTTGAKQVWNAYKYEYGPN